MKNIYRNIKATAIYFLLGIFVATLFNVYLPFDELYSYFGTNAKMGVVFSALIGIPLYFCGGGTIPILLEWLSGGMTIGAATAFMLTGPATKIVNLGALKIILGLKNFSLYLLYNFIFAIVLGMLLNLAL